LGPEAERSSLHDLTQIQSMRTLPMPGHPMFEWDATALMRDVTAPTLIVCSRNSTPTKPTVLDDGRQMAAAIPNSHLQVLEGVYTPFFSPNQSAILKAVDAFLQPDTLPRIQAGFRTIVFTDIVDSTRFMSEVGDEEGRKAVRAVEKRVSSLADRHGGRVVKNLGDGSLVSFNSNTAALRFALEVQAEIEPDSLQLRIGMAAGEPIEEGGDIHGAVVAYASRVAGLGGAGEIIASDTVRQLALGKGFEFKSMGQFELKGFNEPATVWKVSPNLG
jgi:class 3 adenylate cyclase